MKYAFTDFLDHMDQARQDALKWIQGVKGANDPQVIAAYNAGFDQGARDAVQAIKLHGGFKFANELPFNVKR